MNHVLVTGGAGYIGSHVCKALADAGFTPVTFDDLSTGSKDFVKWGPLVEGDIRDRDRLDHAIASFNPKAVLHFAARIEIEASVRDPLTFYDANVAGTITLLEATRGLPMVFSSTCAVYEPRMFPMAEFRRLSPVNPYGASKRMAEDAIQACNPRHMILRYFNAAGSGGETGEGSLRETHLIPAVLKAAAFKKPVTIFGSDYPTNDRTAVRDYIHVVELAKAHVMALQHLLGGNSGIFNLGSGTGHSVSEVIDIAEVVTGQKLTRVLADRRDGDPAHLVANTDAAFKTFGWKAEATLEEIVSSTWNWLTRNV